MNKAKLVELADEVLTNIDVDMQSVLRKELEVSLCAKLYDIFFEARQHHTCHLQLLKTYGKDDGQIGKNEKSYKAVKPILDDCIDKLLGERSE